METETVVRKHELTDKEYLRAFVDPVLYPFLVDLYQEQFRGEDTLKADIKLAREKYKEIVGEERGQTVSTRGKKSKSK